MYFLLVVLGSLVAVAGTIPYIVETVKGNTKPRLVSWLTWAVLAGVAAIASLADGQIAAGLFAGLSAVVLATVLVVGWRYGDRSFKALDITCLAGVGIGLALWWLFNDPAIAVWAVIIIDFIGLVPTALHAWKQPHEETPITFALAAAGGLLTSIAVAHVQGISMTSIGYSLYVAISLGVVTAIILARRAGKTAV
ncbi:MAG TPA: hypothetical protein VLE73_00670 [Candidatus Saccharimonadales bacterium]|nr:hypothetical protein [Candidatus Saccharimonadales bacterium]